MAKHGCRCPTKTRATYVVTRRKIATLYGGGVIPSKYSEVKCMRCGGKWRSAAKYVDRLRNHRERKYHRLTDAHILELLNAGHIKVNKLSGEVFKQKKRRMYWTDDWILLTQHLDRTGYPYVCIRWNGHRKSAMVHKLVWMSVSRELVPEGYDVDHRDRNPLNSCIHNLRLRTIAQNRGRHVDDDNSF